MDEGMRAAPDSTGLALARPRWSLAFLALVGYLVVEYSRLQLMYPVLEPLHLSKVFVALCAVGLLVSQLVRAEKRPSRRIDLTMLAFLFGVLLSDLFGRFPAASWDGFIDALKWVVLYFLLSRILTSAWRLRIFVFLLLLLNFKLAQFVIGYYFMELSWGRSQKYLATAPLRLELAAGSYSISSHSALESGMQMFREYPISGVGCCEFRSCLMDVGLLAPDGILRNLRHGRYAIRSRFFRSDSGARLSRMEALSVRLLSRQLANMRKARSLLLRLSS